jgi:hypothetical protein
VATSLMISSDNARSAAPVRGSRRARIFYAPPFASSTGREAIDLGRMAGLLLDEWQARHLIAGLGETKQGRWAALESALVAPRQNGKNGELEVRQLTGLFLLEEDLQIHSAHKADTSVEQFLRLEALIDGTPEFARRVRKMDRGKGSEAIQLHRHPRTGKAPRLRFRTRTSGGARGFSADTVYLDEAYDLPESFHGALMPIVSAKSITGNPQLWYSSSAVDQEIHPDGIVLARLRERALKGTDPSLVYAEHSIDAESPDAVTPEMATDPERWAMANPALGIRISPGHVAMEQRSMSARTFAVERLGVGDWPATDDSAKRPIAPEAWDACKDTSSVPAEPVALAFDVDPERAHACVAIAGWRDDGKPHVEVLEHRRSTNWVVDLVKAVIAKRAPAIILADVSGQAASLLPDFAAQEIEVAPVSKAEHAQGCGMIFDDVADGELRHLGTPELKEAIRGAVKLKLSDRWAWSRTDSTVDITPLVAVTLARWGLATMDPPGEPTVWDLREL